MDRIELRQSRKLGEQLNLTFHFIRENSRPLWKCMLYIVGPATLLNGALLGYFLVGTVSSDFAAELMDPVLGMILGLLFSVLTGVLLQGVANEYVRLYRETGYGAVTVDAVWQAVRARAGRLTVTMLAIAGIYVAGYLLLIFIGAAGAFLFFLAMLGLIIPGIYAAVPFMLVFAVRTHEDLSLSNSITRAFELVKGYWWMNFLLYLALLFIAWYIAMVCVVPTSVVLGVVGVFEADGADSSIRIIVMIMLALGSMLSYMTALLPTLGVALNYFNLVEKHEAVGLLGRIEAIGTAEPESRSFSAY